MYSSTKYLLLLLTAALFSCSAGKATTGKEKKKKGEATLSEDQLIKLKTYFFEANREKMLGNFEEAEKNFDACLGIYPNHAPSIYEIALIKRQMSQNRTALEMMKQVVEIDPSNKYYLESLAQLYEDNREFENAAKVFEDLIEMKPREVGYYEAKAHLHLMAADAKSAMKVYEEMEDQFGVTESSSMQKQKIYMAMGKNDKAIEEAKKLIEVAPGTARYYNNLADLYHKSGNDEMAMQTYEKLLEIDPSNAFVQLSMATYYYEAGKKEEGMEVMKKAFANPALDFDSKARILYSNVAFQDVPQGQVNPFAFELLDLMKEPHGEVGQLYAIEGDLKYQQGKKEDAKKAYTKSLELDENQFLVWSQVLLIESEMNDWSGVFSDATKALELFPTQGSFYYFQGVAALQLKKPQAAIDAFEKGKDLVVDNKSLRGQFYSNLGDAYHQLEDFENSDKYFEKALEIDPNDMLVLNNWSYYLSLRGVRLDEAEKMSRKTVDMDPESSTYLDTYAWILYKKADYEEAKKWMQFALNNGGDKEAVIVEHFGDILYKLGDQAGALEYWLKAEKLGEGSEFLKKKIDTKVLYE